MNVKDTISIHSFLIKAKEDKRFYTKHKRELNQLLKLFDTEFDALDSKKPSKIDFNKIRTSVPLIVRLFLDYINSS